MDWTGFPDLPIRMHRGGQGAMYLASAFPPWAGRSAGAKRVVWFPDSVPAPHDDSIDLSLARCASVMHSVSPIGRL